ncbi:tyrosine-type recombinase/integrase [Clostridium sp. UBA1652]|uniref:tyrosine-type recombinase/integrase n=1 Tax=Clostridium sp. UBA1652 TaxID=1946348 RepID=UPI00257CA1B7|nr:tyrosine-type recombinase/integrase [Clostridium sp. UBA1652]
MSSVVINELDNLDIIIEEKIDFNSVDEEKYVRLFEEKVLNGMIRAESNFNDSEWVVIIGGVEKKFIFPNEIEFKKMSNLFDRDRKEFELAYRSYILLNVHKYAALRAFNYKMRKIADNNDTSKFDNRTGGLFKGFIEYVKVPYKKFKYFEKFVDEESKDNKERILPEFIDIFKMSDIIKDIVENKKIINYKDYLLTIIWWQMCSIVPLRPSEFIRTIFKCNAQEGENFYLKVFRSRAKNGEYIKNASKIEEYYEEDTIKIDKSLYNLIEEYKYILKTIFNYTKEKELFPFDIVGQSGYHNMNSKTKRKTNLDTITYNDLKVNIERFYIDVVYKEYGFTPISKYIKRDKDETFIEKLTPYDLRHVAIINLVLLGVDVLEVMYLAGHKEINTTFGYYNHVKTFSKGYALGYAKVHNKDHIIKHIDKNTDTRKEDFSRIMNQINNVNTQPKLVRGGYCYYHDIDRDLSLCLKYERNHGMCKYFVADSKEYYKEEIEKVENKLDTDIKMLIELIKDMDGICKFNELYQTTSSRISRLIYKLSTLNTKLINFRE